MKINKKPNLWAGGMLGHLAKSQNRGTNLGGLPIMGGIGMPQRRRNLKRKSRLDNPMDNPMGVSSTGNPFMNIAQDAAQAYAASAAAGGSYKVKKAQDGLTSPAESSDPPNFLQKLVEWFREGKPFRREQQNLEDEAFMDEAARDAERYEAKWGPGGTREERLRDKAMNRAINEFYGQSSDTSNPGYISTKEIMNNPEEYSEMLDAIPDEIYQKHFGRLWDRSEFFRKLLFKSPEESESGMSEEDIQAMGRGMASGAASMMGRR